MQSFRGKNIGTILVERGCLTPEQLSVLIDRQVESRRRFAEIAVHEGFVTDEDLARALAEL